MAGNIVGNRESKGAVWLSWKEQVTRKLSWIQVHRIPEKKFRVREA